MRCAVALLLALATSLSAIGGQGVAFAASTDAAVGSEVYRALACAAERPAGKLRQVLDARDQKAVDRAAMTMDGVQACQLGLGVRDGEDVRPISGDTPAMRGLIAEAYLKRDKVTADLSVLMPQPSYDRDWYAFTGRPRPLDEMATCVADSDPAGIRKLIQTEFGSGNQRAAIAALTPSLGPCLGKDYQLNANATALRAALAEALYHRTFDASGTQAN